MGRMWKAALLVCALAVYASGQTIVMQGAGCTRLPPGEPASLRAQPGDGSVTLTWDRPRNGKCLAVLLTSASSPHALSTCSMQHVPLAGRKLKLWRCLMQQASPCCCRRLRGRVGRGRGSPGRQQPHLLPATHQDPPIQRHHRPAPERPALHVHRPGKCFGRASPATPTLLHVLL
jgi:hypothetical protein